MAKLVSLVTDSVSGTDGVFRLDVTPSLAKALASLQAVYTAANTAAKAVKYGDRLFSVEFLDSVGMWYCEVGDQYGGIDESGVEYSDWGVLSKEVVYTEYELACMTIVVTSIGVFFTASLDESSETLETPILPWEALAQLTKGDVQGFSKTKHSEE